MFDGQGTSGNESMKPSGSALQLTSLADGGVNL